MYFEKKKREKDMKALTAVIRCKRSGWLGRTDHAIPS